MLFRSAKIGENQITVRITAPVRLDPIATLVNVSAVEPSPLCPDPSREKGREEEERAQDPPSLSLLFLHDADRHDRARADPQHAAAETKPPSTRARPPCPVLLDARCQGPRTGELLDALALVSPAYKSPATR